MQSRERVLLAVAVGIAALLVLFWGYNLISGSYQKRNDKIAALDNQLSNKNNTVLRGILAKRYLTRWHEQSLPSNFQKAQDHYQDWLRNEVKETQMKDVAFTPNTRGESKSKTAPYQKLTCRINCKGNLAQLVQFLYRFYRADHLHRINLLSVEPIEKSELLKLRFNVEALIVANASRTDELNKDTSNRLQHNSLDIYLNKIVERNIFGYPNSRPTFASSDESEKGTLGQTVSVRLKASDADKKDKLTYSLAQESSTDAKISSTGTFSWKPMKEEDLGTHEFTVTVKDNGLPPKSVSKKISVEVTRADFELAKISKKSVYIDQPFSTSVRFASIDPLAKVEYALGSDAPEGISIDETGKIKWTPGSELANTNHDIKIIAKDNSYQPARQSEQSFEIAVIKPTPKVVKLDTKAKFTILSAIVQSKDSTALEAWFVSKITGASIALKEGETLNSGNFSGKIIAIKDRSVEIQNGKSTFMIDLGESLDAATPSATGGL